MLLRSSYLAGNLRYAIENIQNVSASNSATYLKHAMLPFRGRTTRE
jgi:hypothetical protein